MKRQKKKLEKRRKRKDGYNTITRKTSKSSISSQKDKKKDFDGRGADNKTKKIGTNWEYITSNFKNLICLLGVCLGAYFIYKGVRDENMNIKIGDLVFNTSMVGAIIIFIFAIVLWRNRAKVNV